MTMKHRIAALAGVCLLAIPLAAYAAGSFSTLPIVGGSSFCASTVTGTGGLGGITGQGQGATGSICAQTVPGGPTGLSGEEIIPADTQLANGAPPQTAGIPSGLLGYHVNRLIGGDFATNAWQRGTTPLSAASPTTTTMSADRWGVYNSNASSQGSTVTVIKETAAADSLPSLGLNASLRMQRVAAQTGTNDICVGQTLDQEQAQALIGKNATFSFYALAGGNYSAANSNVKVTVAYYTAADSATPLTNTDAFMKGTITGYQAAIGGVSPGTTGVVASGVATIPISATWMRYGVWAPIPAANASGTAVVGAGVTICETPVGTAGTNDWMEIEAAQLQGDTGVATASLPNGIISPTGFERRAVAIEQQLEYYYSWGLKEPGAGNLTTGVPVLCSATANALIGIALPVTMRATPTLILTAGGWDIQTAVAKTAIGTTTLVSGSTNQQVTLTSAAACTSTLPYQLVSTSTTGLIMLSAEP